MANTDESIREASRSGEEYLRAQIQIAIAADQRAVSLGGILVAAAAVVLGFVVGSPGEMSAGVIYLGFFLSIGLVIAAGLAFFSARPITFWVPGNVPRNWSEDIEKEIPLSEAIRGQNEHIYEQIEDNRALMLTNGRLLLSSMIVASAVTFISSVLALCVAL